MPARAASPEESLLHAARNHATHPSATLGHIIVGYCTVSIAKLLESFDEVSATWLSAGRLLVPVEAAQDSRAGRVGIPDKPSSHRCLRPETGQRVTSIAVNFLLEFPCNGKAEGDGGASAPSKNRRRRTAMCGSERVSPQSSICVTRHEEWALSAGFSEAC